MNSSKFFAVFVVEALYYLPHFLPVADEMKRRGLPHVWLFSGEAGRYSDIIGADLGLKIITGTPENAKTGADFYIFGNAYEKLPSVPGVTVLIYHGIGTKACYYEQELNRFKIRFIEGEYRRKELDARSPSPEQERPVVGLSKLDPVVHFSSADREALLLSLGLETSLNTVLYAPTYYPSSIELMDDRFPEDLKDLNIIIKPHQFTYGRRYKKELRILESWGKYGNVYLAKQEEFNILKFYPVSDIMISDESSAVFEFAALERPVIRNRFTKLRLSYRLFPWKLRNRMDIGIERYKDIAMDSHNYHETLKILYEILSNPHAEDPRIRQYSRDLLGEIDGRVSERIVDFLISYVKR
jgi:hypothetical protein